LASPDLVEYYRRRAGGYESIYAKPERQADLSVLRAQIPARMAGRRVLEIACGTGYWTVLVARTAASVVATDAGEFNLGLTVCYDLRFPELYRALAVMGTTVITVPSAFTEVTGRDHWHVLLRARAIENQLFVVAANQFGEAPPHYRSYGHSLIADPWGRVLAEVDEGEGFAAADLDFAELERIRAELPSLANRRPEAYRRPLLAEAPA